MLTVTAMSSRSSRTRRPDARCTRSAPSAAGDRALRRRRCAGCPHSSRESPEGVQVRAGGRAAHRPARRTGTERDARQAVVAPAPRRASRDARLDSGSLRRMAASAAGSPMVVARRCARRSDSRRRAIGRVAPTHREPTIARGLAPSAAHPRLPTRRCVRGCRAHPVVARRTGDGRRPRRGGEDRDRSNRAGDRVRQPPPDHEVGAAGSVPRMRTAAIRWPTSTDATPSCLGG